MSTIQTAMLCTRCKEILNNQDDIFGTSCGHLYHFLCIRECHGRSTNCTHCEAFKPSIFKMFQDFAKAPISLEDQTKIFELHNELQENKSTINRLEEKYKISQTTVQQLEGKLKKLDDALKGKDSIISDFEDRITTIEEFNKFLSTENEQINESKNNDDNASTTKNQEIKLNHLKTQLDGEIAKNFQLSIEILKLKSIISLTNNDNANCLSKFSEKFFGKKPNEIVSDDKKSDEVLESKQRIENIQENSNNNYIEYISEDDEQSSNPHNSKYSSSVVIRNYRKKSLKYPLEKNVIYLASIMKLKLQHDQIDNITQIKSKDHNLITLIVLFNDNKIKEEFLTNRKLLKNNINTKCIKILNNIEESDL